MRDKQDRSLQERYDSLQLFCLELSEHVRELESDLSQAHHELQYFHEFINYKNLNEEYRFFAENAYEHYDEESPFPRLTL